MKVFAAACLLMLATSGALGQERFLKFVDEAAEDPSFLAFRTRLIVAAERRDTKFILSVLDRNIKVSFGGDGGLADFTDYWKIESGDPRFWDEFRPVIKNGGVWLRENGRRTGTFTAPYSFQGFPENLDVYEHSVIFGRDVNLRERPSVDSRWLGTLSYNIVKVIDSVMKKGSDNKADWQKVRTLGGTTGWVKAEFVRSPIDYRAGFEKKRGVWKMTFFIAGD